MHLNIYEQLCYYFNIYEQDQFHAQLSCAWKNVLQPLGLVKDHFLQVKII